MFHHDGNAPVAFAIDIMKWHIRHNTILGEES